MSCILLGWILFMAGACIGALIMAMMAASRDDR